MERLTERLENGVINVKYASQHEAAIHRLASIEDILGDEYDLDRLRELVQADREGRAHILAPSNEPRMINADKLARRIAGHSNYHGDSILAAIYCAAEGRKNAAPIRPVETPMNNWVNRVRELDELYTKIKVVTGFTAEQLLEMFAAGYTLEGPDYSKSHTELANLVGTAPSNEPLTLEAFRHPQLCQMVGKTVHVIRQGEVDNSEGATVFALGDCKTDSGCLCYHELYGKTWIAYRIPTKMEGQA